MDGVALADCFYRSAQVFGRLMRDIYKTLPVILVCGGGVALGASFGYLVFLRLCAGCMVWTAIVGALATTVAVTLIAYFKAGILTQETIDIAVRGVSRESLFPP
jgi:choline transporter-like protein 2/4/5